MVHLSPHPRLLLLLLVLAGAVLLGSPLAIRAQDDPLDPFGDEPGSEVRPTPVETLTITTTEPIRERDTFSGYVQRIEDPRGGTYEGDAVTVRRIPFEDDLTFETRSYDLAQLPELLGAPPDTPGTVSTESKVYLVDYSESTRGTVYEIPYNKILAIDYPQTWLDIFQDLMQETWDTLGPEALIEDLEWFEDEYANELATDFSDRMLDAYQAARLDWFQQARNAAPEAVSVYVAYGSYLETLGRIDDALRLYEMAEARELPDVEGRLALRTASILYRELQLPDRALMRLYEVPVWACLGEIQAVDEAGLPLTDAAGQPITEPCATRYAGQYPPPVCEACGEEGQIQLYITTLVALEASLLRAEVLVSTERNAEALEFLDGLIMDLETMLIEKRDLSSEAEMELDDATIAEKRDAARILRGRAYLKQGQLYHSGVDFAAIPSTSPHYKEAQVRLGTALFYSKDYREVIQTLAQNGNLQSVRQAVQAARGSQDPVADPRYDPYYDETVTPYDPVLSQAMSLLANAELGRLARQAERRGQAAGTQDLVGQYAAQAMRYAPDSDAPFLAMAEHAHRQPNPSVRALAGEWLDRAEALNPLNPMLYYRRGLYAAEAGDFTEAIAMMREALKLEPEFLDAYAALGEMFYRLAVEADSPGDEGSSGGTGPNREDLLQEAMGFFNNALMLDPDRWDIRLKLGHCNLERAQFELARAERLGEELRITSAGAGLLRTRHLRAIAATRGALAKAEQDLDLEATPTPRVLDVVFATASGIPQVVLNVGSEAGVAPGVRFRLLDIEATDLLVEVMQDGVESYYCRAEPVGYNASGTVRGQFDPLDPGVAQGDPAGEPTIIREGETYPHILHPEETLIAAAALGYVHYLRDYLSTIQMEEDEEYTPSNDLQQAISYLRFATEMPQRANRSDLETHSSYLYALECLTAIRQNRARVQWRDRFDRDVPYPVGQPDLELSYLGQGWWLNRQRDLALVLGIPEGEGYLTITNKPPDLPPTQTGSFELTTVTRHESAETFFALEAEYVVNPATHFPTHMGEGHAGLIVEAIPPSDPAQQVEAEATLVLDWYREGDQTRFTVGPNRSLVSGFRQLSVPQEALNEIPGAIRSVRVERRLDEEASRYRWVLVVDRRIEVPIPGVPDAFAQTRGGRDNLFRVGVFVRPPATAAEFTLKVDTIRIVRETAE